MHYEETIRRIEQINHLIRIKGTGTASQLAERLGMSRRSVYNHLNMMKDLGAPIKYCSYRNSYYYDEEGSFKISFLFVKEVQKTVANSIGIIVPFLLATQFFLHS